MRLAPDPPSEASAGPAARDAAPPRRRLLAQGAALAVLCSPLARPATGAARRVASSLRIVIPANAGGGWDQTGRALGAALVACGAAERVEYENVGGKGGTIGLARFAERHGDDPDALLIGGMVMVGAVALQKPAVNMSHIQPIARLTSDYLVVAVPADSPIRNARDLVAALRADPARQSFAGGSAGGVDHMFVYLLARAAKADPAHLVYKPFPGGAQVIEALLKGDARMGVSGYSEFSEALAGGRLRAIGVSARRELFGLPSFRKQGLDADMANWRAVFTGRQVGAARVQALLDAVKQATQHDSWQRALRHNRWEPSWQAGRDFSSFLEQEHTMASAMTYLLKLRN
ncbi:Tripartite tricarboxylate transporter family receptor [Delftia tsuruhatensis]|uniref:Bug family tripartite tricarboxylate transporter substrate binding protein n=1 Tax=Delftia tsuruhatensis TaxID=180282 RepID=UPI001E785BEB|nr:tripartite tricarboxylate transporter substrate-binding protein [Delftia tsuruhatensis]CAB5659159.1 Tripartite tricarboxylate transporter family receptor [Delftia tsuruhatensis]CAC9679590.1 Tripartite tricarboxylate transporter family receptor [Delftia tsuruhatensis]